MAIATAKLVTALRSTAARLASGVAYRWTHMGACNCGQLAQTVSRHSPEQIRAWALEKRGDWADQALEFCPSSGYPIDHVIEQLLALGLERSDLVHLERLSCPRVLSRLGPELRRRLSYRERDHVVAYFLAFADLLEAALRPSAPTERAA